MDILKKINGIKIVTALCFILAVNSLMRIISISDIAEGAFYLFFAVVCYQAGAGLLKRRNRDRKIAIVVVALTFITTAMDAYLLFIVPLLSDNFISSGIGRWITLLLLIISTYSFFVLFNKKTKEEFS
ncbi:MAG: hypothetical protein OEZ33_10770 [Gammaproteobacteria bacterium]|nr:hypothetical protein [Gammaproteobacteria bacterium]